MERDGTGSARWFALARFKGPLLTLCFVGLLAANLGTLVSGRFHDALYTGLRAMLLVGGKVLAEHALRNSKHEAVALENRAVKDQRDRAVGELEQERRRSKNVEVALNEERSRHVKAKADLSDLQSRHAKVSRELASGSKLAKAKAAEVRLRLRTGVARNIGSIPGEAIPYVGIGVNIAMIGLDIYDACQTMKDFNELLRLLGEGPENDEFCGQKWPTLPPIPTRSQVLDGVRDQWKRSLDEAAAQARKVPHVQVPEVRLPSAKEALGAVCPLLSQLPGC